MVYLGITSHLMSLRKEGLLREPDLGAQIAVDVCRLLEKCMVWKLSRLCPLLWVHPVMVCKNVNHLLKWTHHAVLPKDCPGCGGTLLRPLPICWRWREMLFLCAEQHGCHKRCWLASELSGACRADVPPVILRVVFRPCCWDPSHQLYICISASGLDPLYSL